MSLSVSAIVLFSRSSVKSSIVPSRRENFEQIFAFPLLFCSYRKPRLSPTTVKYHLSCLCLHEQCISQSLPFLLGCILRNYTRAISICKSQYVRNKRSYHFDSESWLLRETKVSAFTSLLLRSVPPVDDIGAQQVPLCVDRYFRPFLISFSFVVFQVFNSLGKR